MKLMERLRDLAIVLCLLLALGGCDAESASEKDAAAKKAGKQTGGKPLIGLLVYKANDTYIRGVSKAFQEEAEGRATIELVAAGGDQLTQNEQIDAMLQKGVSALAVNIVDTQAAARAVDVIKKAGIPVVFFNREPDMNSLKRYAKARFVGTPLDDAGLIQGDVIADLWRKHPEYDKNKDGVCQYIMLQATLDNPEALARTQYSVQQARAKGVVMAQVGAPLLCDWDDQLAYEAMRLILPQQAGTIEMVIANNDAMALGAIRALNTSGYNLAGGERFIPVVGVDAMPEAVEAIAKGIMSGTVVQDGAAMGKTVARMLLNAIDGKDLLAGVPWTWDAGGIAVRIPYAPYTNSR